MGVYVNSNEAIEANGATSAAKRDGQFYISRTPDDTGLYPDAGEVFDVWHGEQWVDYTTLSGVVNFAQDDADFKYVDIIPMDDNLVEGAETNVVLTLSPTNLYNLEPTATSALVTINDTTTTVVVTPDGDAVEPHPASSVSNKPANSRSTDPMRSDYPALTVSYQLTGTAASGIDYTNMTGTVTFQSKTNWCWFSSNRYSMAASKGDEMVTLTP